MKIKDRYLQEMDKAIETKYTILKLKNEKIRNILRKQLMNQLLDLRIEFAKHYN